MSDDNDKPLWAQHLDEIVQRRMEATGESLYEAREHVARFLLTTCDDLWDDLH